MEPNKRDEPNNRDGHNKMTFYRDGENCWKTVENAHIISAEPNYRDGGNSGNLIAVMGELNNRDGEPNNRDGVPNNRDGAFHGEPNNCDGEPNKCDGRWGGLWPAPENSF